MVRDPNQARDSQCDEVKAYMNMSQFMAKHAGTFQRVDHLCTIAKRTGFIDPKCSYVDFCGMVNQWLKNYPENICPSGRIFDSVIDLVQAIMVVPSLMKVVPTCEGWWWRKYPGRDWRPVKIDRYEGGLYMHGRVIPEDNSEWSGPFNPPEEKTL